MVQGSRDDWLASARSLLARTTTISPAELSRKLRLPWSTAASLLETLEADGLVSAADAKTGRRHVRDASGALQQPRRPYRRRRTWEEGLLGWLQRRTGKE
jgi:Mn-dependent DtxR family transcriptional regulator